MKAFYSLWKDQGDFRRTQLVVGTLFVCTSFAVWFFYIALLYHQKSKEALNSGQTEIEHVALNFSQKLDRLKLHMLQPNPDSTVVWSALKDLKRIEASSLDELGELEFSCLSNDSAYLLPKSFGLVTTPRDKNDFIFTTKENQPIAFASDNNKFCFAKLTPSFLSTLFPKETNQREVTAFALVSRYRSLMAQETEQAKSPQLMTSSDSLLLGPQQVNQILNNRDPQQETRVEFIQKKLALNLPEGLGVASVSGTNLELLMRWLPAENLIESVQSTLPLIFANVILFALIFFYILSNSKQLYKPMWRVADLLKNSIRSDNFIQYLPHSKIAAWSAFNTSLNSLLEYVEQQKQSATIKTLDDVKMNDAILKTRSFLFTGGTIAFSTQPECRFLTFSNQCFIGIAKESLVFHAVLKDEILIVFATAPAQQITQVFLDSLLLQINSGVGEKFEPLFIQWLAATRAALWQSGLSLDGACFCRISFDGSLKETGGEGEFTLSNDVSEKLLLLLSYRTDSFRNAVENKVPHFINSNSSVIASFEFKL